MNIKQAYRQTSKRTDTYMNERVMMEGCIMDYTQTNLRMISLQGKREVGKCMVHRRLKGGAYLVCTGKMSSSSILSVCRDNEILEEVLLFVHSLFGLFGKDTLESMAGVRQEIIRRRRVLWGIQKLKRLL